jgi:N-methylhydantoinase B
MGFAILRTARSTWLNVARDFSTAIFDAAGRTIAQADFIPVLVGSSRFALAATRQRFGDDIHPGDVVLLNDPYYGGSHLSDLTVCYPIFDGETLVYWVVNKAHYADIGGCVAGGNNPHAVEMIQEGLRLPPLKLYRRGELNEDLRDMLLLNVRDPETFWADLEGQAASARMAQRKLIGLGARYGWATLQACHDAIIETAAREMRAQISAIPPGTYRARVVMEAEPGRDGETNVDVAITVTPDRIHVNYAGTHPQVPSFVNSAFANTYSATCVALYGVLDPDLARNEGTVSVIEVTAPEGSLLNPRPPAPVSLCTLTTAELIIEVCWKALSEAIPDRTVAGWARTCTPTTFGYVPGTTRWYTMSHFLSHGGAGAGASHDGWPFLSPSISGGALTKPNVETIEAHYPYRVLMHEFLEDACGAGELRGGMGVHYRMMPLDHEAGGVLRGSLRVAPYGLAGGTPGTLHRPRIIRADGSVEALTPNTSFVLKPGDVFENRSSGGGGWGDPARRPVERVREDVRNGLISAEHARIHYRVAVEPDRAAAVSPPDAEAAAARSRH